MGHLAPGDERERRVRRQAEQLEHPAPGDRLERRTSPASAPRGPVFWSQAETSQSAASDAGSAPPITNPKNRPEPIAVMPGSRDARELLDDGERVGGAVREAGRRAAASISR